MAGSQLYFLPLLVINKIINKKISNGTEEIHISNKEFVSWKEWPKYLDTHKDTYVANKHTKSQNHSSSGKCKNHDTSNHLSMKIIF